MALELGKTLDQYF